MKRTPKSKFNPMDVHPVVPNTRVEYEYKSFLSGATGHHDGLWDGKNWLIREPYTTGRFVAPDPHDILTGWRPYEGEPYRG